jgi:hypothetical protein
LICEPEVFREIAQQTGAATLNVSATSNSIAAEMANFVPGQGGLNANAMLAADLSAYILLEVYPQYDFHDSVQAIESLDNKNTFVISMNSFKDKEVARCNSNKSANTFNTFQAGLDSLGALTAAANDCITPSILICEPEVS